MSSNPPDLDELERLATAAAPGPWHSQYDTVRIADGQTVAWVNNDRPEDAWFIAAANPETVLALCAALRVAQEATRTAQEDADRLAPLAWHPTSCCIFHTRRSRCTCGAEKALEAHAAAVAARTTNGEPQ